MMSAKETASAIEDLDNTWFIAVVKEVKDTIRGMEPLIAPTQRHLEKFVGVLREYIPSKLPPFRTSIIELTRLPMPPHHLGLCSEFHH